MPEETSPKATREKVRELRAGLRAQGLRPIEIWVPDVRARGFATQAHLQSAQIAASEGEADEQRWLNSLSALFPEG